jgi:flavin reductase (DIM6/NTAB) family NADH-FMN oxidoreductase RutF
MTRDDALSGLSDLLPQLDPAMVVVTTIAGDEPAGCLVGFHAQCSIEPIRYVVWLSKANHTYRTALRATHLAVHFLDRGDRELAELFGATSGDDVDKFTRCRWTAGAGGVPVLDDCPNHLVGRRVALLDEGSDHVCVVVEPVESSTGGSLDPMRLHDVSDLDPGHDAADRPLPPTERAP